MDEQLLPMQKDWLFALQWLCKALVWQCPVCSKSDAIPLYNVAYMSVSSPFSTQFLHAASVKIGVILS